MGAAIAPVSVNRRPPRFRYPDEYSWFTKESESHWQTVKGSNRQRRSLNGEFAFEDSGTEQHDARSEKYQRNTLLNALDSSSCEID